MNQSVRANQVSPREVKNKTNSFSLSVESHCITIGNDDSETLNRRKIQNTAPLGRPIGFGHGCLESPPKTGVTKSPQTVTDPADAGHEPADYNHQPSRARSCTLTASWATPHLADRIWRLTRRPWVELPQLRTALVAGAALHGTGTRHVDGT